MAPSQEKAQSALYRFRQAQAIEMNMPLNGPPESRPKTTAGVTSLRDCERWRKEIIRELDRRISKIQDYGLNEYEVRDLNDEINQYLRDKITWEKHIVALGGANYLASSGGLMLDQEGNEVPGSQGYKYFGRAKELPGVKELFNRSEEQEKQLESYRSQRFRRFQNQSGAYFGNEDETDPELLAEEVEAENYGWDQGCARIAAALQLPNTKSFPKIPRAAPTPLKLSTDSNNTQTDPVIPNLNAIDARELEMPAMPERKEIERFLLRAKKAALREECE
ncbi:NineTeen Complex (NTC) component [Malassezia psittaci]|uniref:NineTeen Complex (NTC) component n=1 Tax=Malassezia psittaci TaxID=1821823 RepID=A0AAF0F615_9BASI|nr:NineTeen Complex (NTC) component [Malassezia psittaci]